jgi:hypothetical protein
MPLFLESEIDPFFPDLNNEQNRELETFLRRISKMPELVENEPYIIGTVTLGRLLRMKKVIEF